MGPELTEQVSSTIFIDVTRALGATRPLRVTIEANGEKHPGAVTIEVESVQATSRHFELRAEDLERLAAIVAEYRKYSSNGPHDSRGVCPIHGYVKRSKSYSCPACSPDVEPAVEVAATDVEPIMVETAPIPAPPIEPAPAANPLDDMPF